MFDILYLKLKRTYTVYLFRTNAATLILKTLLQKILRRKQEKRRKKFLNLLQQDRHGSHLQETYGKVLTELHALTLTK